MHPCSRGPIAISNRYRANSYRAVIPTGLAGTVANRHRGRGQVTGPIVNSGDLLASTSVANLRTQAGGQIAIVTLNLVNANRHQDFAMVGGHRLALAHAYAGRSLALVAHSRALAVPPFNGKLKGLIVVRSMRAVATVLDNANYCDGICRNATDSYRNNAKSVQLSIRTFPPTH